MCDQDSLLAFAFASPFLYFKKITWYCYSLANLVFKLENWSNRDITVVCKDTCLSLILSLNAPHISVIF